MVSALTAGLKATVMFVPLVNALYEGLHEQFIETLVKFEDGRTGSVSATLNISDAKTFLHMVKVA